MLLFIYSSSSSALQAGKLTTPMSVFVEAFSLVFVAVRGGSRKIIDAKCSPKVEIYECI